MKTTAIVLSAVTVFCLGMLTGGTIMDNKMKIALIMKDTDIALLKNSLRAKEAQYERLEENAEMYSEHLTYLMEKESKRLGLDSLKIVK